MTVNDYKNPLTLAIQNLGKEDDRATKTADGWEISKDDLTIQPSCYPIIKGTLIGFPDDQLL